jgi:glycine betaine/proline transport system substrate-binding protein
MKLIKTLFISAILSLSLGSFSAKASECGKVQVAEMTWTSAAVLAYFDALVLKEAFGCDTEVVPGDTMPTSTSMAEKQQPDIASELWTNGLGAAWTDALERGVVKTGGLSFTGGGEGFWIPKSVVDAHPELATMEGVLANPQLFPHPEGIDKGAFYGCPAGWNCQITTTNLFDAYGMADAGFEYVDPGSGAALGASAAGAHDKGEGWIGYYWGPTALLGTRDFVRVSPGAGNEQTADNWSCITDASYPGDCEKSYYANAVIEVAFTTEFEARAPKAVMKYLNNRTFSDKDVGVILDVVDQEAYSPEEAAEYMVKERQDLWVPIVCGAVGRKGADCAESAALIAAVQ